MEKVFVTGAAGFIGSNLVDRLLAGGKHIVGWDNFSTGQREFLESASTNPRFKLIEGDCLDLSALIRAMAGCDFVFHLAANADVRFGLDHPHKDLQQNTVATFNVLEAMRAGLSVVASDVGGTAEALDNGRNGILVPCGDPIALSKALGGLIKDADQRRRLGTAARLDYEARFRLDPMVERTAGIYDSILRHAAR